MAIELPSDVTNALARLAGSLRKSNIRGLRPVRPEGIHLTLKFLGDVSEDRLALVSEKLVFVCSQHEPFCLRLADTGVFPNMRSPRVLWIGIEGDLDRLRTFHQHLNASLSELGFGRERREFSPHLTVARIRDGTPAEDRLRAAELLQSSWSPSRLSIKAQASSLMRSILLPDGAKYHRLALASLGENTPSEASV